MNINIKNFIIKDSMSIVDTLKTIDNCNGKVLYVVDDQNVLIGAITDGDIRRYLIKTGDVNNSIKSIYNKSPKFIFQNETHNAETICKEFRIKSLPILDNEKHVMDIYLLDFETNSKDLSKKSLNDVPVIIMAGGKGTRLYPYTKILPKPLIPIGDTPILVRILNKFLEYNINDFYITVNYMAGMIKSYFSEQKFNFNINFVDETKPCGTAGSISLINKTFDKPIIITNCDILINADYDNIYEHHINMKNDITIVSSLKNTLIPYGVLNIEKDGIIKSMSEKPTISHFINTGMYVVNPELLKKIPKGIVYNMPDLAEQVMKEGGKVGIYPISEDSFLDMGEFSEMKRMEERLIRV